MPDTAKTANEAADQAADKADAAAKAAAKAAEPDETAFHDNKRPLSGKAGESGDPDVHYLLAVRDGLQQNRDIFDPPMTPQRKAQLAKMDAEIAAVDAKLAKLGYKGQ